MQRRVAKTVNNAAAQQQLEEIKRHNHAVEGRGIYLAPYKRGKGILQKKKTIKMPAGATTIYSCYNWRNVCNYRIYEVSTRVTLYRARYVETRVVYLNDVDGSGTHWVAYTKRGSRAVYFDSFGNLQPPKKIVRYLGNDVTIMILLNL